MAINMKKQVIAYYNEFDPKAAGWLRQLIKNGNIAPGEVDDRSITDVTASDLNGFSQHHFFAGVGVWSYALRNAGWADNRPVWTASLPCQPFSAAGNQKGKEDERHLLPHFIELVKQCRPNTIFGEQVEAAVRHGWLDDLYAEMERENYACGAVVLGAHSLNKAHQRQRIYWVANANYQHRRQQQQLEGSFGEGAWDELSGGGDVVGLANTKHTRPEGRVSGRQNTEREIINGHAGRNGSNSGLGNSNSNGCKKRSKATSITGHGSSVDATSGVDWLYCRDEKYRPIKSGIKPLVDGVARGMVHSSDSIITPNDSAEARAQRLKGYGNAIVAPVAEEFIKAFMSI